MPGQFLGVGWKFPTGLDENGQITKAEHETCIQQAIWTILSTAPGERVMRPDFGCAIHDVVFSTNTAGTVGEVTRRIREALLEWEPRIDVEDVTASPDPAQPNLLRIEISYRVRSTNNQFNIVYPFYLE